MEEKREESRPAAAPEHHHMEHHNVENHPKKSLISRIFQIKYVTVVLAYFFITLVMFAPLFVHMSSVAPGSGGDTYGNLWSLWWVEHAIFSVHTSIWSTNLLFWPVGGNLIYQTMSPIGSLIVTPFSVISIAFAYNILFLLGFVLSGLTMFILAEYLTKNPYAAFFAGLVFAFSSSHIPLALDHIDWINIEWIPLAAYFLIKMLRETDKRYLSALGLGITIVLATFMGDMEQGLMTIMLLALIVIAYLLFKNKRSMVLRQNFLVGVAIAIVVALIIGSFGFIPLISTLLQPGGVANANLLNDVQHNALWSDDLLSFFLPSYYNGFFNGIAQNYVAIYKGDPSESSSYIGYTVLLLAIYGIYTNFKNNSTRLWLGVAIIFGWLSLGPYLQFAGSVTPLPGLYSLYHLIPVLNVIREPGRFDIVFMMAMGLLAAFGVKTLFDKIQENKKSILANKTYILAGICILFLIESNGYPLTASLRTQDLTNATVPHLYNLIGSLNGNFSVLTLPAFPNPQSLQPALYPGMASYYETSYERPLVGGYLTRENQTELNTLYNIPLAVEATNLELSGEFVFASPVTENYSAETILSLYNYDTQLVTVSRGAYNLSSYALLGEYMISLFGNPIYADNSSLAFSTGNSIQNVFTTSYVSYPQFSNWQQANLRVNGLQYSAWIPSGAGVILVYAPYATSALRNASLAGSQVPASINTTIRFQAVSGSSGGVLELAQATQTGITPISYFNISSKIGSYSAKTVMISGEHGATVLFIPQVANTIAISNITFSSH